MHNSSRHTSYDIDLSNDEWVDSKPDSSILDSSTLNSIEADNSEPQIETTEDQRVEDSAPEADAIKADTNKVDDESNEVKSHDVKSNKFRPNKFRQNRFRQNKFRANRFRLSRFRSDDVELAVAELNSIQSYSTKLGNAEIVADNEALVSATKPSTAIIAVDHSPTPMHVTTGNSLMPMSRLSKMPKTIPNGRRAVLWYLLALIVVIIDQFTKWLAETKLIFNEPIPVIEPFLNWTLAYNEGAAFSFLANAGGWQKWFFSGLTLVISIFLISYLIKAPRNAKVLSTGLALVLGGAIGNNLIDRVRIGKVIDFIHVHYADVWHYPIFNIADMAIMGGVAMIVIDMIFLEGKRSK